MKTIRNPDGNNGGGHREPEYDSAIHDERVYLMALSGKTAKEMAKRFGVSHSTIKRWFKKYESFWASVTKGRDEADEKVVQGLFKRATGYEYDSEKIVVLSDGKEGSHYERVPITAVVIPDPSAAMNWLKNRQPDRWRDKQDIELKKEYIVTLDLDDEKPSKEEGEESEDDF